MDIHADSCIGSEAAEAVAEARDILEVYLRAFLDDERSKGQLTSTTDTASLVRLIVTTLHGTAAMARGGKSAEDLEPVVDSVVSLVV